MGPACGMILADMGVEVIKLEPLKGDSTRRRPGSGAGFFSAFRRNKKSLAIDNSVARGLAVVYKLAAQVVVFSENSRVAAWPG